MKTLSFVIGLFMAPAMVNAECICKPYKHIQYLYNCINREPLSSKIQVPETQYKMRDLIDKFEEKGYEVRWKLLCEEFELLEGPISQWNKEHQNNEDLEGIIDEILFASQLERLFGAVKKPSKQLKNNIELKSKPAGNAGHDKASQIFEGNEKNKDVLKLNDVNAVKRKEGLKSLRLKRSREHTQEIVALLDDADANIRAYAIATLRDFKAYRAREKVADAIKDPDPQVRRSAAYYLGDLRLHKYILEVEKLLQDEDIWVQKAAIESLGKMRAKGKYDEIKWFLADPNLLLQNTAKDTLLKLGYLPHVVAPKNKQHLNEALKNLDSTNPEIRQSAIQSIVIMNANVYVGRIKSKLNDPDPIVVRAAIIALSKLKAKQYAHDITPFLEHKDPMMRRDAMRSLDYMEINNAATTKAKMELFKQKSNRVLAAIKYLLNQQKSDGSWTATNKIVVLDENAEKNYGGTLGATTITKQTLELTRNKSYVDKKLRAKITQAIKKADKFVATHSVKLKPADFDGRTDRTMSYGYNLSHLASMYQEAKSQNEKERLKKIIKTNLESLQSFQKRNGSFGYGEDLESGGATFTTSVVILGLLDLKKKGYGIFHDRINSMLKPATQILKNSKGKYGDNYNYYAVEKEGARYDESVFRNVLNDYALYKATGKYSYAVAVAQRLNKLPYHQNTLRYLIIDSQSDYQIPHREHYSGASVYYYSLGTYYVSRALEELAAFRGEQYIEAFPYEKYVQDQNIYLLQDQHPDGYWHFSGHVTHATDTALALGALLHLEKASDLASQK